MSELPFKVGDYVEFKRIVYPGRDSRVVTEPGSARPILEPAIPEQILPQRGDGRINSIAKAPRKVKRYETVKGEKVEIVDVVQTGRVSAGKGLGTVTAILDDAILVAVQDGLFQMDAVEEAGPNVYGTEGRIS